jgi:hypothetical protein
LRANHAAVGGPNIPPADDSLVTHSVASAPGGPSHVLLSDTEAEHIPGCNMAFRKRCLDAIGGFDPQFRAAGDDVDACWRIQRQGWTIGFSPAAMVWHRRRNSVRGYWKQQRGYGKAEALLERKWPEKYNAAGHYTWNGRLYGGLRGLLGRTRIYHGTWGSAPFQSIYQPAAGLLASLPTLPEWYLAAILLLGLAVMGTVWPTVPGLGGVAGLAVALTVVHALLAAARAPAPRTLESPAERLKFRTLTAALHLLQPLARLDGRVQAGLAPWRCHGARGLRLPRPRRLRLWSESWRSPVERLESIENTIRSSRLPVLRGGDYDAWDLEVRGGGLGGVRLLMTVEEHGAGRQLVRIRLWPTWSPMGLAAMLIIAILSMAALLAGAWALVSLLVAGALALVLVMARACAGAMATVLAALEPAEPCP